MPKKFPKRKDRQELLAELEKLGKVASPELFQKFADAIRTVDNRLNALSEPNEAGLLPTLSEDEKNRLMDLYAEAGNHGEVYLAQMDKDNQAAAKATALVNKLQGLLAKDYDALQLYNPADPKSMPELLEDSRTRTIDLRGRHIKAFGNMQNSRIPMTMKNSQGQRRPGVFTKANRVDITARFTKVLEDAKEVCDDAGKAQLDQLLTSYRNTLNMAGLKTSDKQEYTEKTAKNALIGRMITELRPDHLRHDKLSPSILRQYMEDNDVDLSAVSSEGMKRLTKGLQAMVDTIEVHINGYGLQLQEGSRLDTRNAAMSVVAGLVGASNLVARSEPLKFLADDGQVVEGTFMEFAKGLDLNAHEELGKHLQWNQTGDEAAQNSLKKSLADLQVVDYLCLNVDRHEGNLSYVVNEQGYVTGVQAFDNDSSFGDRVPTRENLNQIAVMSSSMKEKVMNLTPEMLRFALRGHGLTNNELYAASARLHVLQQAVRKNQIKIVHDNKFKELSNADMMRTDSENICGRALRFINEASNYTRDHNVPFAPYREQAPKLSEVGTTDRRSTMGGIQDAGDMVGRLIHDNDDNFKVGKLTSIFRGTSNEFKNMVTAAKDLIALQNRLKESNQMQETQLTDSPESAPALQQLDTAYKTLEEKIDIYFNRKLGQIHAPSVEQLHGRNNYENARIDYAKKLMSAVKNYQDIRSGKETEAQQEDKEFLTQHRKQQELRKENAQPQAGLQ